MQHVDDYILQFPEPVQHRLQTLRRLALEIAPDAEEHFAYGMPAYKFMDKPLIYFGGYKTHIGVYALPVTHAVFAEKLAGFKQGKGSLQCPHSQPLPLDVLRLMVLHRVAAIRRELDTSDTL